MSYSPNHPGGEPLISTELGLGLNYRVIPVAPVFGTESKPPTFDTENVWLRKLTTAAFIGGLAAAAVWSQRYTGISI